MTRLSSEERRAALIQAALRVIARDGIHAATTRAIVAEAEMPLASFHYAFRSRDEMIRELISFVVEHEQIATEAALEEDADVRSTIRAGLQAYFSLVVEHPGREQSMFELMHYALRTPELDDLPRSQYQSYRRAAMAILATGADRAGIEWSIPIDDVARLVVMLTDGLTLAWLADRDADAAGRALDAAADMLSTLTVPRLAPARQRTGQHPTHNQNPTTSREQSR
jgi:DNA-binding transcriptional regulator YbjK